MDFISIDFETQSNRPDYGPDPYTDPILLTSVSIPSGEAFIFDGLAIPDWVIAELKNPKTVKLAHSIPFEAKFIQHNLGFKLQNVWDTLGIERLLTAGKSLGCGLDEVCQRRLGIALDKSIRSNMERGIITDKEREYCKLDAQVLNNIYKQQKAEIMKNGQREAARIENYASLIAAEMELKGIGFDLDLWNEYVNKLYLLRGELQGEIWDALGFSYSIDLFTNVPVGGPSLNSGEKVLTALNRKGIKLKDYQSSTLQEYMFTQNDKEKRNVVEKLLSYKQIDKMLSWGYDKQVHPLTGRVHAHWNPQGTDTFRWSSNSPNLMQVSRPYREDKSINFRHLFKVDEGRSHVGADYSQIELRVLAFVTGEKTLKYAFDNNIDVHTQMAETVLKRAIQSSDERTLGKICNFLIGYGGSAKAFMKTALDYGAYYPPNEAEEYVNRIKNVNTDIESWGKIALQQLLMDGFVQTPVGHRRYFMDEDRETVARNTPIQSFAAGILKDAMCSIYDELQHFDDAFFNLQVHDETGIDCYEEQAKQIKEMELQIMREVGEKWAPDVSITAKGYISNSWEK